eukprot:12313893-Alexandrium_andersonii.AAC.1
MSDGCCGRGREGSRLAEDGVCRQGSMRNSASAEKRSAHLGRPTPCTTSPSLPFNFEPEAVQPLPPCPGFCLGGAARDCSTGSACDG